MLHQTKLSSAVLWGAILSLLALALWTPAEPDAGAAGAAARAARRVPMLWALPIDASAFEESVGRRPSDAERADLQRADSAYLALVGHRSAQQAIGAATRDQLIGAVGTATSAARTVVVGYEQGGALHLRSGGTIALDALADRAEAGGRALVVVALAADAKAPAPGAIPRALDLALALRARLQTSAPVTPRARVDDAPADLAALAGAEQEPDSASADPLAAWRGSLMERTLALVSGEADRRGATARPWRATGAAKGGVILVRVEQGLRH